MKVVCVILAVLMVGLTVWLVWSNLRLDVSVYRIKNKKLPLNFDGYEIAVVADFHNRKRYGKILEEIRKKKPDIIVVNGDFVNGLMPDLDVAEAAMKELTEIAPVYFVSGNHEAYLGSYPLLKNRLLGSGVNMIDDRAVELEMGSEKIRLIGVQDPAFWRKEGEDMEDQVDRKLRELVKREEFNVLAIHRPELLGVYQRCGCDVVLAGHAHGGQVRIPGIGGLYCPNQGLFPRLTEGVHQMGDTTMVISRGLWNASAPVRVNNSPELVFVELGR